MPCHSFTMITKNPKWQCISSCGACCRLCPDERVEALSALDASQTEIYLSMVGNDGWCIHFDKSTKRCQIYENRPDFCDAKMLVKLFNIDSNQLDEFATQCCKDHIRSVYGNHSIVLENFKKTVYC